ncbi:hypothetical protein [Pseudomonas sp. H2_E05]
MRLSSPATPPHPNSGGTFAIQLVAYGGFASAYRTLLNRYDVIELGTRDLGRDEDVEQAARDFTRTHPLATQQLHYLGNAAATRLGNRYAALFPERVARMVLVNGERGMTTRLKRNNRTSRNPPNPAPTVA